MSQDSPALTWDDASSNNAPPSVGYRKTSRNLICSIKGQTIEGTVVKYLPKTLRTSLHGDEHTLKTELMIMASHQPTLAFN